jgi:hypothetical protein
MALGKFALLAASVIVSNSLASPAQAVKKSCWVDHYHNGAGEGPSKASARRAAIGAWEDFVAFEYGDNWGHFKLSKNKKVSCSGSKGNYDCNVSAIPCHRVSARGRK